MLGGLFIAGAADQMARAHRAQTAGEMAARTAAAVRTENESLRFDDDSVESCDGTTGSVQSYPDCCLPSRRGGRRRRRQEAVPG